MNNNKQVLIGHIVRIATDNGGSIATCEKVEDFIKGKFYTDEEVATKLYECLGHFAHKHDITISGNDLEDWIKDNVDERT